MSFIAKYNDNRVTSLDYSHEDFVDLQKEYGTEDNNLVCLECGNLMIPKIRYAHDTQFFAHHPNPDGQPRECSYSEKRSPGLRHRYIQSEIYRIGKLCGYDMNIESRLIDGKRVADVLVNNKTVIEVQDISATESSLIKRTDDYISDNKKIVWFFISPDKPKRSTKSKLSQLIERLPAFEVGTGGCKGTNGESRMWGVWCSRPKEEFYALVNLLPKLITGYNFKNSKEGIK